MRIFAISDIHIDYKENKRWISNLSLYDYQNDVLIIAGDISHQELLVREAFTILSKRFKELMFIPGNHDLWVRRKTGSDSFEALKKIHEIAEDYGVSYKPRHFNQLSIVPLYGWYDYSFGKPSNELYDVWMDYLTCIWPTFIEKQGITEYFISLNKTVLDVQNEFVISFSHFLPRIDVMPYYIPEYGRKLYPVLGSTQIESQIRQLGSHIHVYGHSHVNVNTKKDNVVYINNALGYPSETLITSKELLCIYEC